MSDPRSARVAAAFRRLDERLAAWPDLRRRVDAWLRGLSPGAAAADYFLQRRTLPMLELPAWVEATLGVPADEAFQLDLACSTIAGYCHIRVIDDVMDDDPAADRRLLPASGFFHAEFHGAYMRHFAPGDAFWRHFERLWFGAAEAAVADAWLRGITLQQFRDTVALKVCPVLIPVAATCLRHGRADVLPAWEDVIGRLGCIAQMTDDLCDWQDDLAADGRSSYFLDEAARRRAPQEPVSAWILREGFSWGLETLHSWHLDLEPLVAALGSADLAAHLMEERQALDTRAAALLPGYRTLAALAAVWPGGGE